VILEDVGKSERKVRTQTTKSLGSMSLLSRMALSTAPPSLPVALVRASIFVFDVYLGICQVRCCACAALRPDLSTKC
jgi:hypothetical protein